MSTPVSCETTRAWVWSGMCLDGARSCNWRAHSQLATPRYSRKDGIRSENAQPVPSDLGTGLDADTTAIS